MAYLTKHNLSKLCRKVSLNQEITKELFAEKVYNNFEVFNILNKVQREYLFKYAMLIYDEKEFESIFYQFVPPVPDPQETVFYEGGTIKYHLDSNCIYLTQDFKDFLIPEEIRQFGDEAIYEFRNWFKVNNFREKFLNGEISSGAILMAYNLKYPKKYGLEPLSEESNILLIAIPNSNTSFVESEFNIPNFELELGKLINIWDREINCPVAKTYAKHSYLLRKSDSEIEAKMAALFSPVFVKNMGIEKLRNKLLIAHTVSFKITLMLLDYLKWTYNLTEKVFDEVTLEYFGLECCRGCKNN